MVVSLVVDAFSVYLAAAASQAAVALRSSSLIRSCGGIGTGPHAPGPAAADFSEQVRFQAGFALVLGGYLVEARAHDTVGDAVAGRAGVSAPARPAPARVRPWPSAAALPGRAARVGAARCGRPGGSVRPGCRGRCGRSRAGRTPLARRRRSPSCRRPCCTSPLARVATCPAVAMPLRLGSRPALRRCSGPTGRESAGTMSARFSM